MNIDPIETIVANSFRDYHVRGFDYLCLSRTEAETVKVYFFDGNVSHLPEVVIPHDHRYPFTTEVLAGRSRNRRYMRNAKGLVDAKPYEAFDYRTPLNGGSGFAWSATEWLMETEDSPFEPGDWYTQRADEIHTIQIAGPGTVLLLRQLADVVSLDQPTRAYQPAGMRQPPSLDGLYSRMTPDYALERLEQAAALFKALPAVRA